MGKFFDRPDFGKLVIRVVLGFIFAWFGVKMLGGGRSALVILDRPFTLFSITLAPRTWILTASIVYLIAGILFMAGSFFKTCCMALTVVELILIRQSAYVNHAEVDLLLLHVVLAAICFGFIFINPGRYSASS
ncbi:MAG: hypothetical protein LBS68_02800 [Puniceicoccales bacterium]|jgi:uncharacterized membrane protein YphA (DoxX/SURF4 family)|nr:hypothetical protein [Puniceicoccales bacterium]